MSHYPQPRWPHLQGRRRATPGASRYEASLRTEKSFITSTGALAVSSGAKTGRCPGDKRIVDEPVGWWAFTNEVWWGKVRVGAALRGRCIGR